MKANDLDFSIHVSTVKSLAGELDRVARDRGVEGTLELLAQIAVEVRNAEWRGNDLIWKQSKERHEQGEK